VEAFAEKKRPIAVFIKAQIKACADRLLTLNELYLPILTLNQTNEYV